MATDIKVPELGEGVESGDVLEVFVSVGDVIEKDADLIELETDKATVAVPASAGGKIVKIHVAEGDTIAVGAVVVSVDAVAGEAEAAEPPAAAEPPKPEPAPKAEPPKAAPEPPKPVEAATPAPAAPAPTTPASPAAPAAVAKPATGSGNGAAIPAGPAIRRLAREVGIDLGSLSGTGDFGRITREDVMKAVRGGASRSGGAVAGGQSDGYGIVRIEKMPKIRQTIARKMHESWVSVPRVTNFDDADVTDLEDMRQNSKADYASNGIKLTSMPFIIKAVAVSLKAHPVINASIDLDNGQIIYKDYVNVGIAVDTERGLVVPSIRNADQLAIPEIARNLSDMAENVRDNKFSVEDLRGGTFTISNLGAIGGTYSTPIINVPETAILLIGRSRKMPIVVDDKIQIRLMMPLSISYDHRLIDGGAAARFLNEVKSYLQAPSRLLLAP